MMIYWLERFLVNQLGWTESSFIKRLVWVGVPVLRLMGICGVYGFLNSESKYYEHRWLFTLTGMPGIVVLVSSYTLILTVQKSNAIDAIEVAFEDEQN